MRVYAASSWRNQNLTAVVTAMREEGHEVYDFREDRIDGAAFHWTDIDPEWQRWTPEQFKAALSDPIAQRGYIQDKVALDHAEALVLVLPCNRSAHLELGYTLGKGIPAAILLADGEPELMYNAANVVCVNFGELSQWLRTLEQVAQNFFWKKPRRIRGGNPHPLDTQKP